MEEGWAGGMLWEPCIGKDRGQGQDAWMGAQVNKFEQIQVVVTWGPLLCKEREGLTDASENIAFQQLCWSAVKYDITGLRYDQAY